jgi:hypothetical protein
MVAMLFRPHSLCLYFTHRLLAKELACSTHFQIIVLFQTYSTFPPHLFQCFSFGYMADHKELYLFGRAVPTKADENAFVER